MSQSGKKSVQVHDFVITAVEEWANHMVDNEGVEIETVVLALQQVITRWTLSKAAEQITDAVPNYTRSGPSSVVVTDFDGDVPRNQRPDIASDQGISQSEKDARRVHLTVVKSRLKD